MALKRPNSFCGCVRFDDNPTNNDAIMLRNTVYVSELKDVSIQTMGRLEVHVQRAAY